MIAVRGVYFANVIVAGIVGSLSLCAPRLAAAQVWQRTATADDASLRVVGAFWLAIALLSLAGIRWPVAMAPLLVIQLLYKGGWLLTALLDRGSGRPLPSGIAVFFAIWLMVLPFVIPVREWLTSAR